MDGAVFYGCLRPDSNQHTLKAHAPEACVSTISPLRLFTVGKYKTIFHKNVLCGFNFFKNLHRLDDFL